MDIPEPQKKALYAAREFEELLGSDYSGRSYDEREHEETTSEEEDVMTEEDEPEEEEEGRQDMLNAEKETVEQKEVDTDMQNESGNEETNDEDLYEEFDLCGMTKAEVRAMNKLAPAGQRLEDVMTKDKEPDNMTTLINHASSPQTSREARASPLQPQLSTFQLQLEAFITNHSFTKLLNRDEAFSTSDRRSFERDLYDFVRSFGFRSTAARGVIWQVKSQWQPESLDSGTEWEGEVLEALDHRRPAIDMPGVTSAAFKTDVRGGPSIGGFALSQMPVPDLNLEALTKDISKFGEALLRPFSTQRQTKDSRRLPKRHKKERRIKHSASLDLKTDTEVKSQSNNTSKPKDDEREAMREARKKAKKERRAVAKKQRNDRISLTASQQKRGEAEEQCHDSQVQIAKVDAQVRGIRDYSNAKQVQVFENGGMKNADKEMKDDLKDMKSRRDYMRDADEQTKLKRKRESTSTTNYARNVETQQQAHPGGEKPKKRKRRKLISNSIDGVTAVAKDKSSGFDSKAHSPTISPSPLQTLLPARLQDEAPSSRTRSKTQDRAAPSENLSEPRPDNESPKLKRVRSQTKSPYFPIKKEPSPKKTPSPRKHVSCIPFPPLSASSFGLAQERLRQTPFHLLIACVFLTKTRGTVSMPVFYDLIARYPTPGALAEAIHGDVVAIFQHLGLQNQRAKRVVNMAKAWRNDPPQKGKRYRCLNYPCAGDGKDLKSNECIDDDDARIAWEIAHIPGVGAYAFDSWRIFCRDSLRGLDDVDEMDREWSRVLPLDKELRAYLRWRWLKNGWIWDPMTGEKRKAEPNELSRAGAGGVMVEGDDGGSVAAVKSEADLQDTVKVDDESGAMSLAMGLRDAGAAAEHEVPKPET